MSGFNPGTRTGLIALLAARRIKAEKLRREKAAHARTKEEVLQARKAKAETKRSGWFR
ncbi:MAG: hypothetical protein KF910_03285 [Brevundimonas sp.]|uniref:hypothetical protein n=1 Tax=Brevundimonas sp. TaxID=1871086 RepID=UPI0025BBADA5|nr:hypothetical protein [Brevundimonas sp.]MBX3476606.1 hypothetical protein [Brevundimonas sp.]